MGTTWRRQTVAAWRPNAAHHVLAAWSRRIPDFDGLITQNVDGLHEEAGTAHVIRLHGSIWRVRCVRAGCAAGVAREDRRSRYAIPPHCTCGALLRPDIVWFGEALDPDSIGRAQAAAVDCEVFLTVGTSAVVYPAAGLVHEARGQRGIHCGGEPRGDRGLVARGPCLAARLGRERARRARREADDLTMADADAPIPDPTGRTIDPGVSIGHVHLKVADLERALAFYCDVLGFELTQRYGPQAAFISAGGYHHHIGLNTWDSAAAARPRRARRALYHVAILYPTRAALADALRRLMAAGIPLDGRATTASARRSTCATPTRTASSSTGTVRRRVAAHAGGNGMLPPLNLQGLLRTT